MTFVISLDLVVTVVSFGNPLIQCGVSRNKEHVKLNYAILILNLIIINGAITCIWIYQSLLELYLNLGFHSIGFRNVNFICVTIN